METKFCKKCKQMKPLTEFQTDNRAPDGLWRYCRSCESWRQKSKKALKGKMQKWQNDNESSGLLNIFVSKRNFIKWLKLQGANPRGIREAIKCHIDNIAVNGFHMTSGISGKSAIKLNFRNIIFTSNYIDANPNYDFASDNLSKIEQHIIAVLAHEQNHDILEQQYGSFTSQQYDNIYREWLRKYGFLA